MRNPTLIHFNDTSIISAKVNYSVICKYITFCHSVFTFILSKKVKKKPLSFGYFILWLNHLILFDINACFVKNFKTLLCEHLNMKQFIAIHCAKMSN